MQRASWWRWPVIRDAWATALWPIPVLALLLATGLGVLLPRLDAEYDANLPPTLRDYLFGGGVDSARTVLSVVAGSLVTVTALTFSLTVVTLQLAGSQYSPRVLRTFVRDRFVHGTLAVLLGTFVYTLTVLRTVGDTFDGVGDFVPALAVTFTYLLALASVIVLVMFLAHLARQIRVESIMNEIHDEALRTMRLLGGDGGDPQELPVPPAQSVQLLARSSGFLTAVEEPLLLAAARRAGAVVLLDRSPGDSVLAGTPVGRTWRLESAAPFPPELTQELERHLDHALHLGFERTAAQDIGYGLRQLVDVTVRALSPGINDPTTAVHALGHAASLLCRAAAEPPTHRLLRDGEGRVRVALPRPGLEDLLQVAVAQPVRYGAAEPEVLARLLQLLREVAWCGRAAGHLESTAAPVREQLARVRAASRLTDESERLEVLAKAVEEALSGHWHQR